MYRNTAFFFSLYGLFFLACVQVHKTSEYSYVAPSKSSELGSDRINVATIVTDLEVEPKRQLVTFHGERALPLDAIKAKAIEALIESKKGDVVLEPRYEITFSNGRYTGKISGYIGRYSKLRTATENDLKILLMMDGRSGGDQQQKGSQP